MTNLNALLLDNQLCFALYSTSLAMTQQYKKLLSPLGMTYPQYLIMLLLWERDAVTLKSISERLGIKSGALTPVIKRMEAEGWVQRLRGVENDRTLSIELTPQGRKLKEDAKNVNQCIAASCDLENNEMQSLIEQLSTLKKNLSK